MGVFRCERFIDSFVFVSVWEWNFGLGGIVSGLRFAPFLMLEFGFWNRKMSMILLSLGGTSLVLEYLASCHFL